MEKIEYTEYQETLKPEEEEISVIVQIPKDQSYPVHVVQTAGRKQLRFSLQEFNAVEKFVYDALKEAGWQEVAGGE